VTVSFRILFSVVLATLAATAASATAADRTAAGVSPGLVHRGQNVTFSFRTAPRTRSCSVSVTWSGGATQKLANKKPLAGRVTWVLRVGAAAPLGNAQYSASCNGRLVSAGSFVVVGKKSTAGDSTPRVVVDKQGFSQRNQSFGTGSDLSYGLVLHNLSSTEDAEDVYVIVNMVAANGVLIGSKSTTVKLVPASGTYAYGDSMGLRTQVPVASLELTVRVAKHEPKKGHPMPDLANVRIIPGNDGFVSEVDGELVNDTTPQTLGMTSLSIVFLDANGVPCGGGTGMNGATIPYGSRFVFTAGMGMNAIPLDRAASVVISLDPSYSAPI
jgi:hypothetical protein